ncbi:MAG: competence pheromone ComX [Candidatus Pristimantibacillus sp.]
MLKEAIRSLVGNSERMSMVMGGQVQLAGVSASEYNALQDALKNKEDKQGNYQMSVWL